MQRSYTSMLVAALMTIAAGHALADEAPASKTREQVRAETAEAIRTGDVLDYETGMKLNQLFPGQYAPKAATTHAQKAPAVTQGKTREEVRAEAAEAIRTGDIVDYETGLKLNQLFPGQYASKPTAQAQAHDKAAPTQTASAGN